MINTNNGVGIRSLLLLYISEVDALITSVEKKVYYTWQSYSDEDDPNKIYLSLPEGCSDIKKVDFYFNEIPYSSYSSDSKYLCKDVNVGDIKSLSPGTQIQFDHSRGEWYFGVETDGRPWTQHYMDHSSCNNYWNIALTFYM